MSKIECQHCQSWNEPAATKCWKCKSDIPEEARRAAQAQDAEERAAREKTQAAQQAPQPLTMTPHRIASSKMPGTGALFLAIGVGLALWGVLMDPSQGSGYGDVGRLANLHALNIKTALVIMGSALVVAGAVFIGCGQMVNTLRRAA
jgi:hypothetical protein